MAVQHFYVRLEVGEYRGKPIVTRAQVHLLEERDGKLQPSEDLPDVEMLLDAADAAHLEWRRRGR